MRVAWIWAAGLVLTLGCGRSSSPSPAAKGDVSIAPVPGATDGPPSSAGADPAVAAAPPCDQITLYLHGEPFPGAEVDVAFNRIEVTREGAPVATTLSAAGVLLTFPRVGAYHMAVLPFSPDAGPLEATFAPTRMSRCTLPDETLTGRACTFAETCGGAIQFTFDPAKVRRDHCHVFVRLDLVASMQRREGGWWFVPHYQVQY